MERNRIKELCQIIDHMIGNGLSVKLTLYITDEAISATIEPQTAKEE